MAAFCDSPGRENCCMNPAPPPDDAAAARCCPFYSIPGELIALVLDNEEGKWELTLMAPCAIVPACCA